MPTRDEISEFSTNVIKLANEHRVNCIDAIIDYCNETGLEIEVAATLVSSSLKARIHEEAQSLSLIKRVSSLPI
jgi:hypothetical protein